MNIKYVNLAEILDDAAEQKETVNLNGVDYWVKRDTRPYNDGWDLTGRKSSSWLFIERAEWREQMELWEIKEVEFIG
jgi:hypothetical protein